MNTTNKKLCSFLFHLANCGKDSFKKLERSQIHNCWPHDEEDGNVCLDDETESDLLVEEDEDLIEKNYCSGTNEVVKNFKEKCVICCERYSIYAVRQYDHQCICEQCYQKKGDSDKLKCLVCRT